MLYYITRHLHNHIFFGSLRHKVWHDILESISLFYSHFVMSSGLLTAVNPQRPKKYEQNVSVVSTTQKASVEFSI